MDDYSDSFRAFAAGRPDLAAGLAGARGLSGVLMWMKGRDLPLAAVEIIQQDEFSLDFILPLEAGGEHLVFGVT